MSEDQKPKSLIEKAKDFIGEVEQELEGEAKSVETEVVAEVEQIGHTIEYRTFGRESEQVPPVQTIVTTQSLTKGA